MFTIKVYPDGEEPFELVARSRDLVHWERTGRGRSLGKFSDNPSMTDVYSLAHATCMRQGRFHGPLTEFEERVDVELIPPDDEEDADPTRPVR